MNERNPPPDSASRFFFRSFHCWTISKRRAGAEWKEVAGARLISSPPGNSLAIGFVVRRRSLERRIHVVLAATAPAIAGQNWRRRFTWAIASVLTGHGFMGDASCIESNPLSWARSLPPPIPNPNRHHTRRQNRLQRCGFLPSFPSAWTDIYLHIIIYSFQILRPLLGTETSRKVSSLSQLI